MANGGLYNCLLIGWKRPVPGREQQAMDLFQSATEYYAKSQSEGKIESFEPVILTHHGGDLNGFILIRGNTEKISNFRREDEFINKAIEAGYCLDGFGIVEGASGAGVAEILSRWSNPMSFTGDCAT